MYKKEKNCGFYTMNGNIKIKIDDFEDDITIGHQLDLSCLEKPLHKPLKKKEQHTTIIKYMSSTCFLVLQLTMS